MVKAMKEQDTMVKDLLRVLVSDIQRDPNKDYSDEKVIPIIKKTTKALYDNHNMTDVDLYLIQAEYLERTYLPTQVSSDDVLEFLKSIDQTTLKNKMQMVGMTMKHFPKGSVDGKMIKDMVTSENL